MQTTLDPTQPGIADKTAAGIDRLSSGAHEAVDKTAAGIDRLSSTAHQAVDKTAAGIDRLSSGAHQAVDKVAQVAATAAEQFGQRTTQMRTRQAELTDAARECVRRHPMASIGIALGIGLLLSVLTGGSRR